MSEANSVAGSALFLAWKLSMVMRGRRTRKVWCGGGGRGSSVKVWLGVRGSSAPLKPAGAKLRGRVMEATGLRKEGRIGEAFVSAILRVRTHGRGVERLCSLFFSTPSKVVGDSRDTCRGAVVSLSRRVCEDACWRLVGAGLRRLGSRYGLLRSKLFQIAGMLTARVTVEEETCCSGGIGEEKSVWVSAGP